MLQIRNRTLATDPWRHELRSLDEQPTSAIAPGDVIVSLERWMRDQDALVARGTRIGVRVAPHEDVFRLAGEHLHELWLVELEFPSFSEGRGYSQARQLRNGLGYDADIRAVGDIGRDRIAFMERCGINVFVFEDEQHARDALGAFDELTLSYQAAADAVATVAERRGLRLHAASAL